MNIIKKAFIGLGLLLALFLITAIAVPIIFEDDIKEQMEQEIATAVNADVDFDINNFSLTVFRNFPRVTAEIKDLSVFNKEPFKGNLLFALERLGVEVSLYNLLFEDQIKLQGITLVRPRANIKISKYGEASYNITYPPSDTLKEISDNPTSFSFQINHWKIIDGNITYHDYSNKFKLIVKGMNHSGSGNFNEKLFDLKTHTTSDSISVEMDGVQYIGNKQLQADVILGVSQQYTHFAFKENVIKLNDFGLAFDGWFQMSEKKYDMDIRYSTEKNTFKTLLSLVPGIYTQQFKDIETKGNLSFEGFVKGTYDSQKMPAFNLAVKVSEAMFRYPNLPTAVENINVSLLVDNKDGILDNTRIDLAKLHLDFGKNPLDARMVIENLKNYKMEGKLKTLLNLEDITKIIPVEGLTMKGTFGVEAKAEGIYDSIKKTIPAIDMVVALHDGYIKSNDFPLPLEDMTFDATIKNVSGKMAETTAEVKNLNMLMDGEKFTADIVVENLDDYTWDMNASGKIDLEKMTKIFPVEKMSLSGKVKADIHTKGKMSYVTKKQYELIPTRGEAYLDEFKFTSQDLPYGITIDETHVVFDPKAISLKTMKGTVGKSDFEASGSLGNYMGYLFSQNETIRGKINVHSNLLNLNEFMTTTAEQGEESVVTDEDEPYGVIRIPENVDAVLIASAKNTVMMDYKISNASGNITIKNEVANLKNLTFDLLGGKFRMAGAYNTQNKEVPKYDMGLKIKDMGINQAFNSFSIVKTYAPIAGLATGNFDIDFAAKGKILPDMTPDMATLTGKGIVKIMSMGIKNSKIIAGITALTKLNNSDEVQFEDLQIAMKIDKGRLSAEPFDMQFGDYTTNVKGSVGMDGSLDYLMTIRVPIDKLGSQLQGFANQYVGNSISDIPVTVGIGGTYNKPKLSLKTQEQRKQLQEAAANVLREQGREAIEKVVQSKEAKQFINDVLNLSGKNAKDTTKKGKPLEKLIQKGLQDFFKKKQD